MNLGIHNNGYVIKFVARYTYRPLKVEKTVHY